MLSRGFCKQRGFTMVELLVVISIIGLLATIIFANFSQGKMQARDKVRKAELKEIQLALELYKAQERNYPTALADLAPDYLPEVPRDPGGDVYSYRSDGNSYKVWTDDVEAIQISSFSDEFARCPSAGGNCLTLESIQNVYAVYSVGAETW